MGLRLEGIRHRFGTHIVFEALDLAVRPGEIVCLLGPSGCGKTTLLRIAAGLERQAAGRVLVNDRVVSDAERHVPPEARNVGLMFQDFALFPHMTVGANVAFGLAHLDADERRRRVLEALTRVGMAHRAGDYPHTLSGGQQQRVALARALAPRPAVMLLDEPFSGLDQYTRIQVREDTLGILKESHVATLLVTHHPEEGMFMADRMLVMGPTGRILQEGTPHEVYGTPAHPFVASFFGQVNRLEGVVHEGRVDTPLGPVPTADIGEGARVEIVFREYGVALSADGLEGCAVEILNARPLGRNTFVRFRIAGAENGEAVFRCRYAGAFPEHPAGVVRARILPEHAFVYRMDESRQA